MASTLVIAGSPVVLTTIVAPARDECSRNDSRCSKQHGRKASRYEKQATQDHRPSSKRYEKNPAGNCRVHSMGTHDWKDCSTNPANSGKPFKSSKPRKHESHFQNDDHHQQKRSRSRSSSRSKSLSRSRSRGRRASCSHNDSAESHAYFNNDLVDSEDDRKKPAKRARKRLCKGKRKAPKKRRKKFAMKSNDAIPRKTKMSPKDPRSTLLTEVSSALTKARKARASFSHVRIGIGRIRRSQRTSHTRHWRYLHVGILAQREQQCTPR